MGDSSCYGGGGGTDGEQDAGRQCERLVAHVERYDGAPDECTIYPEAVDGAALVTRWVTAVEGGFVDLGEMR